MIESVLVHPADEADVAELADVAASTFPMACPPSAPADDIAAFVATHLSARRFAEYVTDPNRTVLIATFDDRILGYVILIRDGPDVELSKMYLLADQHSTGAAAELMQAGIDWAADCGAHTLWLGVNQKNERAQRFYRKHGFSVKGTRTFPLGNTVENDFVMGRSL